MAQVDFQVLLARSDVESPSFSPLDFINELLPNEQSLAEIDVVIGKVNASMQKIDEDIRKDIRYYSTQRTKATNAFRASQVSITELFGKIHEIKAKAEKSENMVQEICRDIKSLDHAKVHITASIKTLRRLHMLVSAVEQLRSRSTARHYREVGNLLEAINQLTPAFVEFKTIQRIDEINAEMKVLKQCLEEQSKEEFRRYDAQINNNIGAGVGPSVLRDVCFVVSALGPTTQTAFIAWFVETQIQDYKTSFPAQAEVSRLEQVDRRYAWLMRELKYFEEVGYSKIFPLDWQLPIKIADEFCISTRLDIAALLESSKDHIHVPVLLQSLRKTVDFEKDLCKKLTEQGSPKVVQQKNGQEEIIETGELDDEDADGFYLKFSAEAIKKKWEKHLQLKEKVKSQQPVEPTQAQIQASIVNQFKGKISTCFDPYMDSFIREEDKNMKTLLEKIVGEETWISPVSPHNKVLPSSADLIYYFNEARKKCAPLTKGQPLFDLFLLFKKYLTEYAGAMNHKISDYPIHASPKALSDNDELATIMIINTAEYCTAMTAQISQTIAKIIDEKFVDRIDLSAAAEAFSAVSSKGLKALANHIEGKMETALHAMVKIKWGEIEQVGEQSTYATQIVDVLKNLLPRFKVALTGPHFQYICDVFVTSFVSRGIMQNIYKSKKINNEGAHQLLLDVATIKDALLHVVGHPPPTRFSKLVLKEIGRVEAVLKLLTMPNDAIVKGYYTMIPDGTDADLNRILGLKGMKKDERKDLLQYHQNSPPPAASHPLPPSTLSAPMPLRSSSSNQNSARPHSPAPLARSSSPTISSDLFGFPSVSATTSPTITPPASPAIPSFFSQGTSSAAQAAIKASLKNFFS